MGLLWSLGQIVGHALNAAPGYSTLGANITNPNVNYQGQPNPKPAPKAPAVSQPAPAPQPQPSGVLTGGGGGSGTVDPAVAAFLGQQIEGVQGQIGALDPQLATGRANILNSGNAATNTENDAFGRATRDYNTQRGNTIADEMAAKENIDTGVRQQTSTLQRLLGLAGSGNSSASEVLAPYAASRQGDQQRQGVQTSYGRNLQSTDTAYGDTTSSHNKNLTDIQQQEFQNEQNLEAQIANTKASLLQTLAGLTLQQADAAGTSLPAAQAHAQPYMDQIAQIVAAAAGLGQQYQNPISLNAPSVYAPPSLDSYNYDVSKAPIMSGAGPSPDANTPVAPLALGPLQKKPSALTGQ